MKHELTMERLRELQALPLEAIYAYRRALNGIKPKKGDAAKELASKLPQDEITPEERKEQATQLAEAAAK